MVHVGAIGAGQMSCLAARLMNVQCVDRESPRVLALHVENNSPRASARFVLPQFGQLHFCTVECRFVPQLPQTPEYSGKVLQPP